jgi:hypothetical protein
MSRKGREEEFGQLLVSLLNIVARTKASRREHMVKRGTIGRPGIDESEEDLLLKFTAKTDGPNTPQESVDEAKAHFAPDF